MAIHNKIKTPLLLVLAFLFLVSLASASSVTLDVPTSAKPISGIGVSLNATILNSTGAPATNENWHNCTFYAMSPSTNLTSWFIINVTQNISANQFTFNGTFNSRQITQDSSDYSFKVLCYNNNTGISGLVGSVTATNTGITVDNTKPENPTSVTPTDKTTDNDGKVVFSASVTDSNTTGCGLRLGTTNYRMTYSGSSCTYTVSNIPEQVYTWYIFAEDGLNTTPSTVRTLTIDKPTSAKKAGYMLDQAGVETVGPHAFTIAGEESTIAQYTKNPWVWVGAIAVISLIIFAIWKSKRR